MRAPTGNQHHLVAVGPSGTSTATITEVAAGLRSYAVDGIDLVETFPESVQPPMASGIVLVPWPNRIRDGRWTHDGVTRQLALTEPVKQNASHGLLRFAPYREVTSTKNSITLAATVFPQSGYPFQLDTTVTYTLTPDGLDVTHWVQNVGADAAPYAVGAHPYFQIGGVPTRDLSLTTSAATRILVDERSNPIGTESVAGTPFDLRAGRLVGDLDLDAGFEDVTVIDGRVEHTLAAPDGRSLTVWGDDSMRFVQLYTPRNFPTIANTAASVHQAVAIEPMTAPADAFNSGKGVHWLQPGADWTVRWGITHHGFTGGESQ
ncbi:aldose 1-epimerase family protein [Leifsonia sp. A12D58]|uniref:aldose 1-epimerase family protein n=1 Tax=Leifsonia sp. A12D58 TaxID=3397674 RepID=UPI0039E0BE96